MAQNTEYFIIYIHQYIDGLACLVYYVKIYHKSILYLYDSVGVPL